MPGFSITLLLLPSKDEVDAPSADLVLSLLDEKCEVPGWKWASGTPPLSAAIQVEAAKEATIPVNDMKATSVPDPAAFVESIKRAANALIEAEPEITRMDSIAGDGDCGLTLKVNFSSPYPLTSY